MEEKKKHNRLKENSKKESSNHYKSNEYKELKTDEPLSEKDEVKRAEEKLRKGGKG